MVASLEGLAKWVLEPLFRWQLKSKLINKRGGFMRTNYEHDPILDGFLTLLENDIQSNPQRLNAVTPELVSCIEGLVGEVEVDLDAPIPDSFT